MNEIYRDLLKERQRKVYLRIACLLPAFLLVLTVFAVIFAAVLSIILLTAVGILALPVSAGMLSGLLTNVSTDLAPPAMAFAGASCIFASLSLICLLFLIFPKLVIKSDALISWFFCYGDDGSTKD